jgi:DNA invertase Pin-like site-specific DNA recombinase
MIMEGRFVAYYRVSTDHQGIDGNGILAQRRAVEDYLDGGRWKLVAEFTEVESGKRSDRPELERALAACKKHKAKLVIAKLDRLSRNVHFISGLMERKIDFVACDMPSANAFMINIYAAVAQEERRMISERTKAGLRAARARGVVLGGPALKAINSERQEAAVGRAQAIAAVLAELSDLSTHKAAVELNARGVPTATGALWSAKTVWRARNHLTE